MLKLKFSKFVNVQSYWNAGCLSYIFRGIQTTRGPLLAWGDWMVVTVMRHFHAIMASLLLNTSWDKVTDETSLGRQCRVCVQSEKHCPQSFCLCFYLSGSEGWRVHPVGSIDAGRVNNCFHTVLSRCLLSERQAYRAGPGPGQCCCCCCWRLGAEWGGSSLLWLEHLFHMTDHFWCYLW